MPRKVSWQTYVTPSFGQTVELYEDAGVYRVKAGGGGLVLGILTVLGGMSMLLVAVLVRE